MGDPLPDEARLMAAIDATWVAAERAPLGEWVVRRSAGAGGRAGSIWMRGDPGMPFNDALAQAAAMQRGWGEQPLLMLPDAEPEHAAAAGAAGWTIGERTTVMAARTADVSAYGTGGLMVVQVRSPLAVMEELWDSTGTDAARRAVMDRTPEPKVSLMLREDDRPAAAAFVAVDGEVAMLHAVMVGEPWRRRGVGRALTAAAAAWAQGAGAPSIGLAVLASNAPAVALYRRMGFEVRGGYRYARQDQA
jgi:ribosomal protein S18 acetylase RimI-like enzyme